MLQVLLQVLILSCITASVCFATPPNLRNEASSALERIQKSAPPDSLYDEYNSIIETFSKAELLWEQNRLDDAEKLFRLSLLKTSLYEKNLDSLLSEPAENSSSPSSKTTPAKTLSVSIPSHGPDPPYAPPTGASPEANPAPKKQTLATSTAGSGENSESMAETRRMIIGGKMIYTVRKGDTLRLIGAKFGVSWRHVAKNNRLNPKKTLKPGQKLTINTLRIIPKTIQDGIVINIPDRTLYFFKNGKLEKAVPVGLGMTSLNEVVVWQTPTGTFRILSKIKNPAWHVPPSIQKEMEQKGKEVKTIVPPGEDNPLGKYALKTSLPGIMIHSTIVPESVYTFSSHGCIRVFPSNMEAIFNEIQVNTRGEIIYQPVKLALTDNGLIFLEVHRDFYDRHKNLQGLAKRLITENKLDSLVDWDKVQSSLRRKAGVPEEITGLKPPKQMITSHKLSPASTPPDTDSNPAPSSLAVRPVSN